MDKKIVDGLKKIVGDENISEGTGGVRGFLRAGWEAPSLICARPSCDEELQQIVDLARDNQVAIITANDRYLLEEDLSKFV